MSTSVTSVVSHFPSAENGFTTTTSGSVSSGAATVGLNSVAGYSNGEIAVFVIDPTDASKKQTFTGTIDTSGVQVTSVVWTAGTNQTHALGATVVDYATATHISMMTKGILVEHNQSGTHSTALITSRTEDTSPDIGADYVLTYDNSATALKKVKPTNFGLTDGWIKNQLPSVSSVTYNGNRSYDVTFGSTVASYLTPGMRVRTSRTVAAPTQCADLEASSSQYFNDTSVSGMTFTDDFAVSAWIKLESYQGASGATIASRYDGSSGWRFDVTDTGLVRLIGHNAGTTNIRYVTTYQSVPLGRWVHVAAQLDMSGYPTVGATNSYIMFDGVDVPAQMLQGGTNPASLVQAGNLNIGAANATAGTFFDGKIAQVAIYSAKVTQANIRATISQGLTGSETSLVSAYSFNNSINDLNTSNANNLTAQGGALATNSDSPFSVDANGTPGGTYDYGIVTKVATTTATVQVPEGCTIPTSGGVSAVDLSAYKVPYGFPAQRGRWRISALHIVNSSTATAATTAYNLLGARILLPAGDFQLGYSGHIYSYKSGATNTGVVESNLSLTQASRTSIGNEFATIQYLGISASTSPELVSLHAMEGGYSVSAATTIYANIYTGNAIDTIAWYASGTTRALIIYAEPAHL